MAQEIGIRPPETNRQRHHRRRRTNTVVFGATLLALAAIGICVIIVFIVKSTTGFVKNYIGPDETSSYFEQYLEPVVMFDPEPFSSLTNVSPKWKLETAIWAALDTGEPNGQYAVTEDGREILPEKDVTTNFEKYFGDAAKPSFESFTGGDFTYEYNKKERCFYIPLVAVTDFYLPRVTNISRKFNTVTLTVDYIPGKNWGQEDTSSELKQGADKTMNIVLTGSKGGYQLKSIEEHAAVQSTSSSSK